jgi:hypothetical protein
MLEPEHWNSVLSSITGTAPSASQQLTALTYDRGEGLAAGMRYPLVANCARY